jgi:hypothetical protein
MLAFVLEQSPTFGETGVQVVDAERQNIHLDSSLENLFALQEGILEVSAARNRKHRSLHG